MDYLYRDSLHAGVPYGQNFDRGRLIGSLCLNEAGDGLAITEKGKTAAEMMVFARYVMFSEVYWHHGVRAATAMLQRAFFLTYPLLDLGTALTHVEADFVRVLSAAGQGTSAGTLLDGLFGPTRRLYKRLAQFSIFQQPDVYHAVARRPFPTLARACESLAELAGRELQRTISPHELLIDAPPVKREIEFRVDVLFPRENRFRSLEEISPVVKALAREQFDDYVKRVRIFAHPDVVESLRAVRALPDMILRAMETATSV
jgi:HD superfamily phosphohydrolase